MNDKIKVLFLDIDNTLLDFDAAAAWAMEQCFQKAGLEYKSEMFAALLPFASVPFVIILYTA